MSGPGKTLAWGLAALAPLAGCGGGSVACPEPSPQRAPSTVEQAIAARRSSREMVSRPIEAAVLQRLAWAAQGVTEREAGHRTAPSAGALYPLEVRVASVAGVARYEPARDMLAVVSQRDVRQSLARAGLGQEVLAQAAAMVVISGRVSRTATRYGERAERFVALEAGHAAQNVLLVAQARGLAAVPIGAFDDRGVRDALGLGEDETPYYLIAVGYPR